MGLISFEMDVRKTTDGSCQRILALWQYDGDAARSLSSTLIRVFLSGDKRVSMLHVLLLSNGLTAGAMIRKFIHSQRAGVRVGLLSQGLLTFTKRCSVITNSYSETCYHEFQKVSHIIFIS